VLNLKTQADLQRLIDDGIPESLTLDFKASPALSKESKSRDELCKDVSAFANSAGGQIVYGIDEKNNKLDDGSELTREWIEQVIDSNVQPRIEGLVITPIQLAKGNGYVITVPQASARAPHQAPDKKYYKRQNFQSVPMEDYEIRDVLRRATTPDLRATLSFSHGDKVALEFRPDDEMSQPIQLMCRIENLSSQPAFHIINDVLIDHRVKVWQLSSKFTHVATRAGPPKMMVMRRTITSPPDLPIFREGDPEAHKEIILLRWFSSLLGDVIRLETVVQTPGFSAIENWEICYRGGFLHLHRI
jgi:hypothetical protein